LKNLKTKIFSKPLRKLVYVAHGLIVYIATLFIKSPERIIIFLPLILIKPGLAASLEITTSPSINLPALVYIETKNTGSNNVPGINIRQAQITSHLSTFVPKIQVLPIGTEIVVSNQDSIFHNTHVFDQGRTLFNVATPTTGVSVQRKLTRPGLFNVRCDLHPFMNAWIAIVSNNDYAFIEKPGVYNINNIESGHYSLHIHRSGEPEKIIPLDFISEEQKKLMI